MLGNESPTQFPIPLAHRANPTAKIAIDADALTNCREPDDETREERPDWEGGRQAKAQPVSFQAMSIGSHLTGLTILN